MELDISQGSFIEQVVPDSAADDAGISPVTLLSQ
jgi:S1-C subfamily serine protease